MNKRISKMMSHHGKPEIADTVKSTEQFLRENWDKLTPDKREELQNLSENVKDGYDDITDKTTDRLKKLQKLLNQLQKDKEEQAALEKDLSEKTIAIDDLLRWITATELKLGSQQPMSEESEPLTNQKDTAQKVKDDVTAHQQPIFITSQSVDELLAKQADKIPEKDKVIIVEKITTMKTRYEVLVVQTEIRVKLLKPAVDNLKKHETDGTTFEDWLTSAEKTINDLARDVAKELDDLKKQDKKVKALNEEIMDHKADVKILNSGGHKFLDDAKVYKKDLAEFRSATLPKHISKEFTEKPDTNIIKNRLNTMNERYNKLKAVTKQHSDKLQELVGKHDKYQDSMDAVLPWLQLKEKEVKQQVEEPVCAEPQGVKRQIDRLKGLNDDLVSRGRDVDKLKTTGKDLSDTQPELKDDIEKTITNADSKYHGLESQVSKRSNVLQTAFTKSQGVQDGLDALLKWLDEVEPKVKKCVTVVIVIKKEILITHLKEIKVILSDVESHKPSVKSVNDSAKELIQNSDLAEAKNIQTKLDDLNKRYDVVLSCVTEREDLLQSLLNRLSDLLEKVDQLEDWLLPTLTFFDSSEVYHMELLDLDARILEITKDVDNYKPLYADIKDVGKGLVDEPEVENKAMISTLLDNVDKNWEALEEALKKRKDQLEDRKQAQKKFSDAVEDADKFLDDVQKKLNELEPVAAEEDTLKKQITETKPIKKQVDDFKPTLEEVTVLGNQLDSLTKPGDDYVQIEPQRSVEVAGVASTKPVPGRSASGVRRRLSDGGSSDELLDEQTEPQKQIADLTDKYNKLSDKLENRDQDLDTMLETVQGVNDKNGALLPMIEWVKAVEETLQSQQPIKSEIEPLKKQLDEQKDVQNDIDEHKKPVEDVVMDTTGFLKENRDKMTPIQQAGLQKTVEDLQKTYADVDDKSKDRLKEIQNTLQHLEADKAEKAALEEKYTKQATAIHDILQWVKQTEKTLGSQQPMNEESKPLTEQYDNNKTIQKDITEQQKPTQQSIQTAQQLLVTQGDKLSSHDRAKLEDDIQSLKARYDVVSVLSETRGKLLKSGVDDLKKFEQEHVTFDKWLTDKEKELQNAVDETGKELDVLKKQNEDIKKFTEDVIDHKADLKFINMSGQKYLENTKEYKTNLVDYRTSALPKEFNKEYVEDAETPVIKDTLKDVNDRYDKLKKQGNQQSQKLSDLLDKHLKYKDALDAVLPWLQQAEEELTSQLKEPVAVEPDEVKEQLQKAKVFPTAQNHSVPLHPIYITPYPTEPIYSPLHPSVPISSSSHLTAPISCLLHPYPSHCTHILSTLSHSTNFIPTAPISRS
uniref:Dystonin-like n=1 Tax=Saccoglossus kowalevskii TaxID=10224 RepID=A0ABM0M681_SACKO|nr:PREDICTED: dystonin-like [Saccoglossus kowalevskii]